MKRIYFCFFLFSLILSSARSQGVSSGYMIDSVVTKVYYDWINAPTSYNHYTTIDSFDLNGLLISSYIFYSDNPTYDITTNKYSPTKKILSSANINFNLNKLRKNYEELYYYDTLDRLIKHSRGSFHYSSNSIIDTPTTSNFDNYFYQYTPNGLQSIQEYNYTSNGIIKYGGRQRIAYDSEGKKTEIIYEQLKQDLSYSLYETTAFEYYPNDSLKTIFKKNVANVSITNKKTEYFYDSTAYLEHTVLSLLDTLNQTFFVYPSTNYFHDSLHYRTKIEVPFESRRVFIFDSERNLVYNLSYQYDEEDSIWYHGDSSYFNYNSQNQLIYKYFLHSGGGGGYLLYKYDSAGFNYYIETQHDNSMGDNSEYKVYISYKKLLHPDAIPDENSFTLFPNPNDGNFNLIYFSSIDEPITIKVHNALGQMVFQETENKTAGYFRMSFTLEKISNGIYFLEFTSTSKRTTKKFLVN
ncbi:MAG: T9SS type A sorting domain-containing protein [Bacteroidetes bacterium]|nr:T9SS type A sorting domain-containing protein [Bacteroidota bacterium]